MDSLVDLVHINARVNHQINYPVKPNLHEADLSQC